ncbi:MAG: oxygen-independent coproporphyrinogen III oxidase [Pseudomonadota bacterium]
MAEFHADLATVSVPRYTSYPTAAEFNGSVGAGQQAAAIDAVRPGEGVSLYVHVPYCNEICWYCGCNTGAVGRGDRLPAYVDAVARESELVAKRLKGRVTRVHFGGGSPNSLAPTEFLLLAEMLRDTFSIGSDAVWAVELDPRGIDPAYAQVIAAAGFSRASLGAQTFSPEIQRRINREQPFAMVAKVAGWLRMAGIAHLNLDMMYGLPGQTLDDLTASLNQCLALEPERVAMFGYAHMPRLLPRQRMIADDALPGAAARFEQSIAAQELMTGAGYVAIGFDHFARPGDSLEKAARSGRLRRNFQGFTDDQDDVLIGLGASAISQFPGLIVQNEKHVGQYRLRVGNDQLAGVRGVTRSIGDRVRGEVIERLLCDGRVDVAAIEARYGQPPRLMVTATDALRALESRGLLVCDGSTVTVTGEGQPYCRLAAAAFDTFRSGSTERFSRAV